MRPFGEGGSLYVPWLRATPSVLYLFLGPPSEDTGETKGQFLICGTYFVP